MRKQKLAKNKAFTNLVSQIHSLIVANFACQLWYDVYYCSWVISDQQFPLKLSNLQTFINYEFNRQNIFTTKAECTPKINDKNVIMLNLPKQQQKL